MTKSKKQWFPLESNPTLINSYISKLGFDTSLYSFTDVFSTEDWALDMIPQPVVAVIMLYPITNVQELHRKQEQEDLFGVKGSSTNASATAPDADKDKDADAITNKVWFIKQRIGNACGTIGILHALGNIPTPLRIAATSSSSSSSSSSWLSSFYEKCPSTLDPIIKAEILENDVEIETMHDAATSDTSMNQTSRGNIDDDVDTHFVAIVNIDNMVYELDGRKEGPIPHGPTMNEYSFLKDACQNVIQKFMDRDPGEMRFTILALAPSSSTLE